MFSAMEKSVVALWRKGRTSLEISQETGIPMRIVRAILDDLKEIL
jgi:hypothetical protein